MYDILLIDDDDSLRNVVAKSLTYAGHTVTQAENGQRGLDLSRSGDFDLVITDIVMPVQEGVETIIALRRERPELPIIAISGGMSNASLYLDMAAKIGARAIVPKPFTPPELLAVIQQVMTNGTPSA